MRGMQRRDTLGRDAFLKIIQGRTARAAISASATRAQGASGVVALAREFASNLRLGPFGTTDRRAFERQLSRATDRLTRRLPKRARSWGLSRKLLNIFLRDCFYTRYLCEAFRLDEAERLYEVPLDSITARRIRKAVPNLPRWRGVKHLERDASTAYQDAAAQVARRSGIARVHLDALWWGIRD